LANLVKLSKFLSLLLRHEPDQFGLVLDADGFTNLDAVWQRISERYGNRYTYADLITLLEETPGGKQRFEVKDGRIRALYGHSGVPITYPPVEPPEILYHGTTREAAAKIRREGLKSQARQYVHLSTDKGRALDVARRHGQPVILRIRALAAHQAGHIFYHPERQHFLVKALPPEFIIFDDAD